ncbi:MAG: cysteine desulfurase NifS [Candidatus Jordarchaeum sp.]|uniref:cysteine desulfurase NifS n=1 Tax=Candidatus Jordarchaeum sp. TaxID=2823881 RepID=UPI00404B112B
MRRIYMDHAATTYVDPEVVQAMLPYFTEFFGNASSFHSYGREAKEALEHSREVVAKALGASPEEIIFTSGGTESDNTAIKGVMYANRSTSHVITSMIEHHAVLETCGYLQEHGFDVTLLPVDKHGFISLNHLEDAITNETGLVTIMHANNEIGTIEPIKEIGRITRENDIYLHTDAVQSFGKIPTNVDDLNVDLLSISGHKIYGPKGVGVLYVREGVKIEPVQFGGGHERGMRSGTENVPGIVGLAKAVEISQREMEKESKRLIRLRDRLIEGVLKINDSWLNGHPTQRLSNNANFSFDRVEGESLILRLDAKGIAASTGSACSSGSGAPSHVLTSIGLTPERASGSLRLTLGKCNTEEDIDYVLEVLPEVVSDLRRISAI